MAPLPAVQNYGHDPTHPLSEIKPSQDLFCSACKHRVSGNKILHCSICKFTLHPFCRTCPLTLSSVTHPPHPLRLFTVPSANNLQRQCNVCSDAIRGSYFTCSTCDFDVHPLCTQIPRQFNHPNLDQTHPLKLQVPSESKVNRLCDVCRTPCDSAYCLYSCAECDVDAHCHCILGRPKSKPQAQARAIHQPSSPVRPPVVKGPMRPSPVMGQPQYSTVPPVVTGPRMRPPSFMGQPQYSVPGRPAAVLYPSQAYYDVQAAMTASSVQANYHQRMANLNYQRIGYNNNPYGYNNNPLNYISNVISGRPNYYNAPNFVQGINHMYTASQGSGNSGGGNGFDSSGISDGGGNGFDSSGISNDGGGGNGFDSSGFNDGGGVDGGGGDYGFDSSGINDGGGMDSFSTEYDWSSLGETDCSQFADMDFSQCSMDDIG